MTAPPVYLVGGLRTPFGRHGGVLASLRADDLAALPIRRLLESLGSVIDIDEVILGCANQAGEDNRNVARMATLLAELPESVPGVTVNRLCASGLEAVVQGARLIKDAMADIVITGGVESMSRAPFVLSKPTTSFARDMELHDTTLGWRFINPVIAERYGTDSMGQTAENVAAEHGITRADQDAYALRSQQRAAAAIASGRLAREITPVSVPRRKGPPVVVDQDEHPRETTLENLSALRPVFHQDGTVTAGNSAGINDGAAAVLLASDAGLSRLELQPLATIGAAASAGVPPRVMGLGPVASTRRLLSRTGLTMADIDLIEINEAFAAQVLACLRDWGVKDDAEWVNPNGGAIALGHPLGASGARLALSAGIELATTEARRALVTMCVGVGQGCSLLLEGMGR